jgi:pantoate--beta-alanine ligase
MEVLKTVRKLREYIKIAQKERKTIGFVPTMGALHQGHISLVKIAKKECDLTICSIFINPTQFNDPADFEKYPITLTEDLQKLNLAKCSAVFIPTVAEMYPKGLSNKKPIQFGFVAETLEGKHRPGHFNGMAQIVEKLLRAVQPDILYMGQKDYQQQLIVGQLIKKRNLKVKLVTGVTIREKDGLAMSSRNVRLNSNGRKLAIEISKTLKLVQKLYRKSQVSLTELERIALKKLLKHEKIEIEYFEIRNARTLKLPRAKSEKLVALAAVKIEGVRLIDNMLLN